MIAIFYLFSSIAIAAAATLLLIKNILHAALLLMVSLISVAAVYVFAGADFLAIAHIMIYIGGILVLILFSIMLTRRNEKAYPSSNNRALWISIPLALSMFILLCTLILKFNYTTLANYSKPFITGSTIQLVGQLLMTNHFIAFELAGIVLLVALMGASCIATQPNEVEKIKKDA